MTLRARWWVEFAIACAIAAALLLVYFGLPAAASRRFQRAERAWAALLYSPREVPERFPGRATDAAGSALYGLTSEAEPLTRHQLTEYVGTQLRKADDRVDPPPAPIAAYLSKNAERLRDLADRILASPPRWGWLSGTLRPDSRLPRPRHLATELEALAFARLSTGDQEAASRAVEARVLLEIDDLLLGNSARYAAPLAIARRLPAESVTWASRFGTGEDVRRRAAEGVAIGLWGTLQERLWDEHEGRILYGIFVHAVIQRPMVAYWRLQEGRDAMLLADRAGVMLHGDLCSAEETPAAATPGTWWAREALGQLRRDLLALELAELAHHARRQRAATSDGVWPETLDRLDSGACPSAPWRYERKGDGTALVARPPGHERLSHRLRPRASLGGATP